MMQPITKEMISSELNRVFVLIFSPEKMGWELKKIGSASYSRIRLGGNRSKPSLAGPHLRLLSATVVPLLMVAMNFAIDYCFIKVYLLNDT